jgi:hypothetical protein
VRSGLTRSSAFALAPSLYSKATRPPPPILIIILFAPNIVHCPPQLNLKTFRAFHERSRAKIQHSSGTLKTALVPVLVSVGVAPCRSVRRFPPFLLVLASHQPPWGTEPHARRRPARTDPRKAKTEEKSAPNARLLTISARGVFF